MTSLPEDFASKVQLPNLAIASEKKEIEKQVISFFNGRTVITGQENQTELQPMMDKIERFVKKTDPKDNWGLNICLDKMRSLSNSIKPDDSLSIKGKKEVSDILLSAGIFTEDRKPVGTPLEPITEETEHEVEDENYEAPVVHAAPEYPEPEEPPSYKPPVVQQPPEYPEPDEPSPRR